MCGTGRARAKGSLLAAFLTALWAVLGLPRTSPAVPVPWLDDGGTLHEYEIYELWDGYNGQSWEYAREYIRQNLGPGWDLATITSAEEQAFVAAAVVGTLVEEYWIGGYQPRESVAAGADWQWVTGEPWGYTNWLAGEPSDSYGMGSEQYLGLANWEGTSQWNDEYAVDNVYGFIAERTLPPSRVPEPATGLLLLAGIAAGVALRVRRDIRGAQARRAG